MKGARPYMLDGLGADQILLGDRAYDSDALRTRMAEQGTWANVKPMPNRKRMPAFSPFLYEYRNRVERFLSKLKLPRSGDSLRQGSRQR